LNALGRAEGAAAAARDAQLSAEAAITRDPHDAEARRMLGSAYFWRATLAPDGTGPEESIALWMKARDVFEALLADEPENPERQRNVALVAKYLGEQYRRAGDLDSALAQHRRAQEIDQQRVARDAGNRQAQLDLALDWSSLGGLYRERGQLPEAALTLEQSLAVRTQLAASDPNDDYTRGRLAHAHLILGAVYADVGRLADGLEHLREAVRLNESRPRDDIQRRLELADSLRYLAQIEHRAGKETPACTHYAEAARLLLPPSSSMAPDSLARQKAIEQTIADGLASCGPLATGRGRQE
jgi:tetratricopeptide (TPR) repeat protein